MLRPRSALVVVAAVLLAWLVVAHVANGLDAAATQQVLGMELAEFGLPGLGSLFLGRASQACERRLGSGGAAADEVRARFLACEFALAGIFQQRGNAQKAKQHYDRIASKCPEAAVAARAWSAYAQARSGAAGAKRALLGLLVDAPKDPVPAYLAGCLFLEDGKVEEAQRYLKKSLALPNGKTCAATLALGQAFAKAGKPEEAADYARQALALAVTPADKRDAAKLLKTAGADGSSATSVWLRTFASRHRWGLVVIGLTVVLLLWPTWLGSLARVIPTAVAPLYLVTRSSEPSAIRAYEAALRQRPDSPHLLRALATAYHRVGVGATRAAELWERLYALTPQDEGSRDRVVRLALESGRETDAALQACQDWFGADPDHPDAGAVAAHLARAYRARATMPPPGALAAVEMAAAAAPTDRDLHVFLGSLYAHYGRHAQAAAVLGELLAASPFDEATRLHYAHALIGAGDAYTAYRHLRLLSPNAETTTDLYLAGIAAHNAGRYHESLRILQEVVRRDPGLFDVEERVAEASARAVRNRLGRYELGETVAVHEACLLHRATHPEHGEVLLLAFRRDFSDALEFPAAFAEHFGGSHDPIPGCARVRDAGSDEEEFYVAYEMPAGAPLSQILEMRGPMPPLEAAQTMSQLVTSLGKLHEAGRLHGDLRLSAVWIDDDVGATLVGAEATLVAEAEPAATAPGARSPFHVAPEVVQRHELSVASDLYAAGCMFYELLVGAPPLQGPTHLATMMAHVTIQPEPPSMRVPNVPKAIDDLVLWALAKDPSQRPNSAAEFVRRLREVGLGAEEAESGAGWAEEGLPPVEGPALMETSPGPPDPARWWTSYHDLTLIATGRFVRVYRGSHRQTGAWHAVKHLQVPRAASAAEGLKSARAAQAILKLFENEMHLLQSLSEADPPVTGITTMLQAYRADEASPAYAMLPMEETLAARVQREGPLPEVEAVQSFVSLAQTVATLHERGIAHRGLSPRSVMFDRAGRTCLGGFDGACRLSERGALLLAEHEVQQATRSPLYVLGDIRYLSPERCRGEEFDERTDVYSLGALLFFMLTGAAPFDQVDEMQIMLDHVSSPPPRVRERGGEVSSRTQEVIDRALAKSPNARFASATGMVSALAGEAPPPRY